MLINVIMPTIVGILTFMSRINTSVLKQEKSHFHYFYFYEQLKFYAQLIELEESLLAFRPGLKQTCSSAQVLANPQSMEIE